MRILIVEDEHKIANALKRGLEQAAYDVDISYDGNDGLAMATTITYDLLIIDRSLTGNYEGLDVIKRVREDDIHIPILLLTTKDGERDRLRGLDSGADDYLAKPFAFQELLARIHALLPRPQDSPTNMLQYDDVTLDAINFTVTRGGEPIRLTYKEFSLLQFFIRNPGRLLSKEILTQHVWDYDADILPNTVEVYIGYLRNKLEKPFNAKPLITTRRGFGYVFGEPKRRVSNYNS